MSRHAVVPTVAAPLAVAAALTLIACGESSPAPPFSPQEGDWSVTDAALSSAGCGALAEIGFFDDTLGAGQTFTLTAGPDDGGFTLGGGATFPGADAGDPLSCDLLANRRDFVCEPSTLELPLDAEAIADLVPEDSPLRELLAGMPPGATVTFVIDVEVDGTFESERTGSTTTALTIDCEGLLCGGLSLLDVELPCTITADAMLEHPGG